MYAMTSGLEQAVVVWETMKQAEQQSLEAPPERRQIGFARDKVNDCSSLQKTSPTTLDPARSVPTL